MKTVGALKYGEYSCVVKVSEEVEMFLNDNNMDLNLALRVGKPEDFFERILFRHEENRELRDFELIYIGIFEEGGRYESNEEICKKNGFKQKEIIMDGSVKVVDGEEFFVRWIVKRN